MLTTCTSTEISFKLHAILDDSAMLSSPFFYGVVPYSFHGVSSFFSPSIVSTDPSSSSTSEGQSIRYNLRNQEVLEEDSWVKGLSKFSRGCSSLQSRGRKSHFSQAQEHALLGVAMGKQSSIKWVVGTVKAQNGVIT